LGILVWQDCMFANLDPPEDDAFKSLVHAGVSAMIGDAAAHPSLAVVCGGSEVEQQAAMQGLGPDRYVMPLFNDDIPALVAAVAPGVPYVTSSPTGGDPPFRVDTGVAHYFGVGAYRRPLDDARRAGVRFASECLAIAIPPERATVERHFGGAEAAGHDPRWKAAVPRDNGTSWDFEDVRDHYVRSLFGDAAAAGLRVTDPEHALDLGRAAASEVMSVAMSEWRRPGSSCAGAVVLALRDQRPGAGWGLIDSDGIPKAPWWALRRIQQPLALLTSDEGLNGLNVHLLNDGAHVVAGRLQVQLFNTAAVLVEESEIQIDLAPRSTRSFSLEELIGGFRDVTWAYRFGPPGQDVAAATFIGERDGEWCQAVHLPGGYARPVEVDLGLSAEALVEDGKWLVEVSTRRFAQWVVIDVPGYRPGDSWFHLVPGAVRRLSLEPLPASADQPHGELRALNCGSPVRIAVRQ
jgi:beta-mannosidase